MYYKRLQKYGKKLAAAILTSALILASGATVYAEDTGEYLAQENIQETESVTRQYFFVIIRRLSRNNSDKII